MSKNKIPTAEDVIKQQWSKYPDEHIDIKSIAGQLLLKKIIQDCMIEFAKLHVKAALEAAADKAEKKSPRVSYYGIGGTKEIPVVCGDIILNAYPETLIK